MTRPVSSGTFGSPQSQPRSLLYIAPGDPAANIAGDQASPADVERIRASLGLDRPYLIRFGEWSWRVLQGGLGTSIFTSLPVTQVISQRIEPFGQRSAEAGLANTGMTISPTPSSPPSARPA